MRPVGFNVHEIMHMPAGEYVGILIVVDERLKLLADDFFRGLRSLSIRRVAPAHDVPDIQPVPANLEPECLKYLAAQFLGHQFFMAHR